MSESVWLKQEGVYVIAEIGLNHNGNLSVAKELISGAAEAGADAVKFQKREVSILATRETLDAPDHRFPFLGTTYREIRESLELSHEEFKALKSMAESLGVDFFVTPFDLPSLDFIRELGVDRFKVASHGLTNLPLLRALAEIGHPVLLSTGMAELSEVEEAVSILDSGVRDIALLHCVSAYPTPPNLARLDLIPELKNSFGLPVGYSGHEVGYLPTLIAVGVGARIVERHITLDNEMEGFDHRLSLNVEDFGKMVSSIREVTSMFGVGQKQVTDAERITRDKYQVSMVSSRPISKGSTLGPDDFTFKNPGTGIQPSRATKLIGKVAVSDIAEDVLLKMEMFR